MEYGSYNIDKHFFVNSGPFFSSQWKEFETLRKSIFSYPMALGEPKQNAAIRDLRQRIIIKSRSVLKLMR